MDRDKTTADLVRAEMRKIAAARKRIRQLTIKAGLWKIHGNR